MASWVEKPKRASKTVSPALPGTGAANGNWHFCGLSKIEIQMKKTASIATLSLFISAAGLSVDSSLASETSMHKYSAEELKSVCDKAGGSYSQDAGGYGCGTNCQGKPGTDCVVACKNNDRNCFAQVPGRARPMSLPNALSRSPRG